MSATDHHEPPSNNQVLDYVIATLGPALCDAIRACALHGYGRNRDLPGILDIVNMRFGSGAPTAAPIVAAAFAFLRAPDGKYVDVLSDTSDLWADEQPLLNTKDAREVAAFALARAAHNDCGQFTVIL